MSYKRHHVDVSTGGAGTQMSSSPSSARRPSTQATYFKTETFDESSPEESKSRRSPTTDAESDGSSDQPGRTRKKAEPVKSACVQCQKRKTKCSGQRPVCRFCSDRNLECSWDIGDGLTRTADLKRKLQEANVKSEELGDLVSAMRSGTDQTSSMLLARLRLGCSMEELLSNIRLDEASGSGEGSQVPVDQQIIARGDNVTTTKGTDYPSPISPEHQFDWPGSGPQFHHMQMNDSWMNTKYSQYYQPNNQQPFYATPNSDQSKMTWPRHDSYYPMDNNIQSETRAQGLSEAQSKHIGPPSGITMVPRNASVALQTHGIAARRGRVAESWKAAMKAANTATL